MNFACQVYESDGFFLLSPNWCRSATASEKIHWANYQRYQLGTPIFFRTQKENFKNYSALIKGWSTPEGSGTWTDGAVSTLLVKLAKKPSENLILTVDALPFVNIKHPNLVADITVNHFYIGKLSYDIKNLGIRRIEVPSSIIDKNNFLEVQFTFRYATSPFKLELSPDTRILGLFIYL